MFVVWSGWGILVLPVVGGTALAVGGPIGAVLNATGHGGLMFLAFSAGLLAAAAANWFVGRRLNSRPGRELLDPRTGERVVLRRVHRLFWIRMEYWSIPVALAALGPLLALRNLAG